MNLRVRSMLYLKVYVRFSFREHLKLHKKLKKKDTFDVVIDGLLDSAIESALKGAPKDALNDLHKDVQETTATFESKQNVANMLHFQLLLIIFNLPTKQAISRGFVGWSGRSQNWSLAQVRQAE